jgi:hypothetical protein
MRKFTVSLKGPSGDLQKSEVMTSGTSDQAKAAAVASMPGYTALTVDPDDNAPAKQPSPTMAKLLADVEALQAQEASTPLPATAAPAATK